MAKGEDSYLKIGEDGEDSHSQIAQKSSQMPSFSNRIFTIFTFLEYRIFTLTS